MKFHISRTSIWDENKPCDEAYKDKYVRIDERVVDDPAKLQNTRLVDTWYNEGRNHRVEDGHIKRDYDAEDWFIKINNLKELIKFINKYGGVVIAKHYDSDNLKLEIYDDYRE